MDQFSRYYTVDKLGACSNGRIPEQQLEKLLKTNYRYFLAFENSNCEDYITEKVFIAFKLVLKQNINFYKKFFRYDLIPIVYGAPKSSYKVLLPENSYIFFEDFQSFEELAK